jgi:hypothetical protein
MYRVWREHTRPQPKLSGLEFKFFSNFLGGQRVMNAKSEVGCVSCICKGGEKAFIYGGGRKVAAIKVIYTLQCLLFYLYKYLGGAFCTT